MQTRFEGDAMEFRARRIDGWVRARGRLRRTVSPRFAKRSDCITSTRRGFLPKIALQGDQRPRAAFMPNLPGRPRLST